MSAFSSMFSEYLRPNEVIFYSSVVPITDRGRIYHLSESWQGAIHRNSGTFANASHIACASSTKSFTAVARVTTASVKDNGSIPMRKMY